MAEEGNEAVEVEAVEATQTAEGQAVETKRRASPSESKPLASAVHKVLLAGIGAVALAQEEIEDFVGRLVERGEIAEADGRKLVKDVMDRRKKQAREQAGKVEDALDKRVEEILARMNVPTKDEIEALSAKISALASKVDELK